MASSGERKNSKVRKPKQLESVKERRVSKDNRRNQESSGEIHNKTSEIKKESITWNKDVKGLYCQKMLEGMRFDKLKRKQSEETCKKRSELMKRLWQQEWYRNKRSKAKEEQMKSEELEKTRDISTEILVKINNAKNRSVLRGMGKNKTISPSS